MSERAKEYSEGDDQFARWLSRVDVILEGRIGLSLFDLEDMMIRDAYDGEETPEDFVEGTVVDAVEENYGIEYADLLREGA
jgi:hypothetical protein